ncbi:hypothetical protein IVB27_39775 [Bradyrhizobium sp. 197]|uniref:hypothetical protein n=1 Tax=unclassified Bradyrhizobium TaxID=2631580 RepID=UPI001FFA66F5|nr:MULTISPECIES: hypothetical protein [unclassified Bradyrhizobium]MCK1405209.1 hypothetical protein [Bradyrhizobium sp. 76]MCK1480701.1 hypothetical protein [Bradyrhizobium sp. 197]
MTNQPDQTISVGDLLALSEDARLGRAADALEKIAAAARQLGRLADAMETLTALLASCIGVGSARCYAEGERVSSEAPLNYLRTGNGAKPFACDADNAESGDE